MPPVLQRPRSDNATAYMAKIGDGWEAQTKDAVNSIVLPTGGHRRDSGEVLLRRLNTTDFHCRGASEHYSDIR